MASWLTKDHYVRISALRFMNTSKSSQFPDAEANGAFEDKATMNMVVPVALFALAFVREGSFTLKL